MVLKGWLMSDFEDLEFQKFVASGDWFLDTEAPDFSEKLYQDMFGKQTPQVQAEQTEDKEWFEKA